MVARFDEVAEQAAAERVDLSDKRFAGRGKEDDLGVGKSVGSYEKRVALAGTNDRGWLDLDVGRGGERQDALGDRQRVERRLDAVDGMRRRTQNVGNRLAVSWLRLRSAKKHVAAQDETLAIVDERVLERLDRSK
jgi:hypothetical protein